MRALVKMTLPFTVSGGIILSMAGAGGCSFQSTQGHKVDSLFLVTENSEIYYQIHAPNQKFNMPYELTEVSALSLREPSTLIMVEDERGVVFQYDLESEKVTARTRFSDNADYEGVELVGEEMFVLESDGDIYRMPYSTGEEVEAEKSETPLIQENDAEGLGYDADKNMLLIACKEEGDIEENKAEGRAIYGYDLDKNELKEDELFAISDQDLIDFFKKHKGVEYEADRIKFHPSAIAMHPIEKRYYIVASTGKLLVVVEPDGEIVATYPILHEVLNQPEGICFAKDGTMYISSEGEGNSGFVLRYRMMNK